MASKMTADKRGRKSNGYTATKPAIDYLQTAKTQAVDSVVLKHVVQENFQLKEMLNKLISKVDESLEEQRNFRESIEQRLEAMERTFE